MLYLGDVLAARMRSGRGSLLAYLMAGSVDESRLLEVVDALASAGVVGLELGFPFSDPMAEGPVIQRAAADALRNGMVWSQLLRLLREASVRLPCAVMTYLNPILQRGTEEALRDIAGAGGSALILPDLPLEEVGPFRRVRRGSGVDTVLLASPATPRARLVQLAHSSEGFLYLVSRYGTTGVSRAPARPAASPDLSSLVGAAHAARPGLPVLIGFGVSAPGDVKRLRKSGAEGVIVGSAFQRMLTEGKRPGDLGALAGSLVDAL